MNSEFLRDWRAIRLRLINQPHFYRTYNYEYILIIIVSHIDRRRIRSRDTFGSIDRACKLDHNHTIRFVLNIKNVRTRTSLGRYTSKSRERQREREREKTLLWSSSLGVQSSATSHQSFIGIMIGNSINHFYFAPTLYNKFICNAYTGRCKYRGHL